MSVLQVSRIMVVLPQSFIPVSLITRHPYCFMSIISDLITSAWTSAGRYKSHLSCPTNPNRRIWLLSFEKFPRCLTRHLSCCGRLGKKVGLRKRNNVLIQIWHTWSKMLTILKSSEWEVGEGHSLTNYFHSYSAVSDQTGIRQGTFLLDLSRASHQPAKRNPPMVCGIKENNLNLCIIFHHFPPLRSGIQYIFLRHA